MAMGRDVLGIVHWLAFGAGLLMTAAAYGDPVHLRSLLFAGVITSCGTAIALLSRWVSRGQVPGSVVPITDAPSVLHLAEANAGEIRQLKARVNGLLLLMHDLIADDEDSGQPAEARRMPRSAVILQFPADRIKASDGARAG